jgi:hypothetical protein
LERAEAVPRMAVAAEAREAQEVSEVSVYSTTVGVVLHYYWVVLLCLSVQVAVGVLLFSSSCCSVKLSWRLAVAGYLTEEAVVGLDSTTVAVVARVVVGLVGLEHWTVDWVDLAVGLEH